MFLSISPAMTIEAIGRTTIEATRQQVAPGGRVLERVGRVRAEEAAAVGPGLLDRHQRGHRARGRSSGSPSWWPRRRAVVACAAASNVIGTPVADQQDGDHHGHGHEDEDQAPHQVEVEVAQVRVAPQPAEGRQHDGQAGGRGDEHQPDDARRAG